MRCFVYSTLLSVLTRGKVARIGKLVENVKEKVRELSDRCIVTIN